MVKKLQEGSLKISELAELFSVSEMTIRRDLKDLQLQELIKISNGLVSLTQRVGYEEDYTLRGGKYVHEKIKIAKASVDLINDGDVVYIDCGTTGRAIAEELIKSEKKLSVFTNSMLVANAITQSNKYITLYMIPGRYRKNSVGFIGALTTEFISDLTFDFAFMGAEGITADYGLSTPDAEEGGTKRAIVKASINVIAVVDSSKFGVRTLNSYASIRDVSHIITNRDPDVNYDIYEQELLSLILV